MSYASKTKVGVDKTRNEIETTLKRYGASSFAYASEPQRATIIFEAADRRVRFELPLPPDEEKYAQARRSRWRALLLCIKAKLEAVASKIETFDEAFLAHVVMPDGFTVGQHTLGPVKQAYLDKKMVPLLAAPEKPA